MMAIFSLNLTLTNSAFCQMNVSVCLCGSQEEYRFFFFCQMAFPGWNVIRYNNKCCNCSIDLGPKSIINSPSSAILDLLFYLAWNTNYYAQLIYQESYDLISFNKLQLFGQETGRRSIKWREAINSESAFPLCVFLNANLIFCQSWIFTGSFNSAYTITTLEWGDVKLYDMEQCHWTRNQNR